MRGQKNILPRNILGKKISCAALLQEKNICLIPLSGKKFWQSESSNPPPLKNQMVRPLNLFPCVWENRPIKFHHFVCIDSCLEKLRYVRKILPTILRKEILIGGPVSRQNLS
jgi:hypothetical protein